MRVSMVKRFYLFFVLFLAIFQGSSKSHEVGGKWGLSGDRVLPSDYTEEEKGTEIEDYGEMDFETINK